MHPFFADEYFDLTSFSHISLFKKEEPVWMTLQSIESYLRSLSLGEIKGQLERGVYLVNPELITIGKGTIVESGAYIKGPCIIGENCEIRNGAYIRGNLVTGDACVIGHATEVKNSIFLDGAHAGHFAYVGDSILGNKVNLGAGTKCANLRFDDQMIRVYWNGGSIHTGLRKLGAILGDFALTGCNSVTNPGTFMGKNSRLAPCTAAHGIVPANFSIKAPNNSVVSL